MMNNLFSTFDPSSSFISLSWGIFLMIPLFLKPSLWSIKSPITKILKTSLESLKQEVKFTLNKTEKSTEAFIISIFLMIIIMNLIALYPQNFSLTSHVSINLPLALLFWSTLMLQGWFNNYNHMLAHLVPMGTPLPLMMFMVLIETVSNMIRPVTLCVRLTANLIAGHLLMTLLGNLLSTLNPSIIMMSFLIPLTLTILESAVACIQAYVFMTLITMYVTEIK